MSQSFHNGVVFVCSALSVDITALCLSGAGPAGYPQQVWGQQQPGPVYPMQPPQQHPQRPMPAMAQPAAPVPPQPAQQSRTSKRIAIINPNTGEEVSTARQEPASTAAAGGEKAADAAAGQTVRARGGGAGEGRMWVCAGVKGVRRCRR